jgi:hypothetical protein
MDTDPFSRITISASGVVSIAFANIGLVLLCKFASEMLPPSGNDLIEMFKDYLTDFASQTWRAVVLELLDDIETVWMQPGLAFRISLHRMYMYWLVALVRIEMKPPALHASAQRMRCARYRE